MSLWPIKVVAKKELQDAFRDKRSIYTIAGPLLFGPLVVTFMFHQLADLKKSAEDIRVAIVGSQFGPVLVDWLQQQSGVEIARPASEAEAAVRERKEEVVLAIDKNYGRDFAQSKSALVQIFFDSSQRSVQSKVARLTSLLNHYGSETAALRLIARGIDPEAAGPITVEEVDLSTPEQRTTIVQVMLMFLLVTILITGMQIATDATAGERERGSLEALLLNPVPRWQFITGKWLAAAVSAFGAMIVSLVLMHTILGRLPLEQVGLRLRLGTPEILLIIAAMAPLCLLAPAIQTYFSCSAKSFKEAQSYSVFFVLPIVFLAMVSMFYSISGQPWLAAVPFLSQYSLAAAMLAGRAISGLTLIVAGIVAAALAAVFLWLAARRFSTEKIIFGR